jgi:hypothetical protein
MTPSPAGPYRAQEIGLGWKVFGPGLSERGLGFDEEWQAEGKRDRLNRVHAAARAACAEELEALVRKHPLRMGWETRDLIATWRTP